MRTIIHLSDLHFGRTRPDLLDPLLASVHAANPDLVVVSGDLTQRARVHQFREARAFLDRIAAPCLAIPGNHDVPLDNIVLRLLGPWYRYRRWIGTNLEPGFQDAELTVVGVNTVNPLDWQRGRIGRREVARICSGFRAREDGRTRIVVAHHPFAHLPQERKALMRGAKRAIAALAGCGADIVLSGHLHAWRAEPLGPSGGNAPAVLLVQAGTGLSTRVRGEENDYNLLRVRPGEVLVERFVARPDRSEFSSAGHARFVRGTAGWQPAGGTELTPNVVAV
jgi:3',5'-cyclic AMP phosphodiesterase CpdA